MVEGPLVHRFAVIHRLLLLEKAFAATSPSGRFAEGASAINGRYISLIEAHGKNIFYFFTSQKLEKAVLANLPEDVVVVHIHFGMTGSFPIFLLPGPEPKAKTRLRLQNEEAKIDAHLTASVCAHGDLEFYRKTIGKLGPDPLRAEADKELVWEKLQKTRKTFGAILMDQSLVAGIGNIYRSEILFASGLHPDQRASTLSRGDFEDLWEQSKRLFRLGLGVSLVPAPAESPKGVVGRGKPDGFTYWGSFPTEGQFYAYRQSICAVCGGPIRTWPSAGRSVYACEACQPLRKTNEGTGDEALVKEVSISQREATRNQSSLVPNEVNLVPKASDNSGTRRSPLNPKTKANSMIDFRTKRVVADNITKHQPFMEIPRDGRRNLTGSRYDFSAVRTGSLWTSASERAGLPRKYHSQASHFSPVLYEGSSWSPWQTFTNQSFLTRRVGAYMTLQVLGAAKPQARIGLQAVSTLCRGSSSPMSMLSTRL
ncbi:unnamed protein product [Calypogeia fissa]